MYRMHMLMGHRILYVAATGSPGFYPPRGPGRACFPGDGPAFLVRPSGCSCRRSAAAARGRRRSYARMRARRKSQGARAMAGMCVCRAHGTSGSGRDRCHTPPWQPATPLATHARRGNAGVFENALPLVVPADQSPLITQMCMGGQPGFI